MCFDESPLMCWALPAQGDRAAEPYQHSSEDTDNGTSTGYQALTSDALRQTADTLVSDDVIVRGGTSGLWSAAAAQLASGFLRSGFYVWLAGGVAVGKSQNGSPQILLHCIN